MKAKTSWWIGWVKYIFYDPFTESQREGIQHTDWEFATSGQAKRAAEALAGALAAPDPVYKSSGRYHRSKNDKSRASRITVVETGASRV
jgi:hypothetical protein